MRAELSIIRALLDEPKAALTVAIPADHFADGFLRSVYAKIAHMVANDKPVDIFTLSDELGGDSAKRLGDLLRSVIGPPANLPYYCEMLAKEAKCRELRAMADGLVTDLKGRSDPDDIIGALADKLATICRTSESRVYDGNGLMSLVVDRVDELTQAHISGKRLGVTSGLVDLDSLTGGFHPGDLIVVGARPKMGKTALMTTAALNAATTGKRVGVVSAEMSGTEIGIRLLAMSAHVPATRYRNGDLDEEDWHKTTHGVQAIDGLPIYLLDQPAASPGDIVRQARAWSLIRGLDILFIDYLQRLNVSGGDNRTLAVGMAAQTLKTLARTLNIPVVVLSQLSRESDKRTDKRPCMADLRDSGMIEQEADQVLLLYRPSVYGKSNDDCEAEIIIDANRHGPVGVVAVRFNPELMMFEGDI